MSEGTIFNQRSFAVSELAGNKVCSYSSDKMYLLLLLKQTYRGNTNVLVL